MARASGIGLEYFVPPSAPASTTLASMASLTSCSSPGHAAAMAENPVAPSLEQYTELAEVAGGFIHDIKNHLGGLSLNLQLLAEDFENAQTQRERRAFERVSRLHEECSKLVELSNNFLRFARAQELRREPTPL